MTKKSTTSVKPLKALLYPSLIGIGSLSHAQIPLENMIVTGVHTPQHIEHSTVAVNVLDRAELERLNKPSLVEVLRTQPGILVNQHGGAGGPADISLRGAESNFVAVYLDGVQVNDPTNARGAAFDFNSINIESIERIEVVKGAQSAVYGSDALAGVIHIITREPGEEAEGYATAEVGTDDLYRLAYGISGKAAGLGYGVHAAHREEHATDAGSRYESNEVNAKVVAEPLDRSQAQLSLRYLSDSRRHYPEQSGGPELAVLDERESAEATEWLAALSWQTVVNDYWTLFLQTSHFDREAEVDSPGVAPFTEVPPLVDHTDYRKTSWRFANQLGTQGELWFNVGADGNRESGTSDGTVDFGMPIPTGFDMTRENRGVFVNGNWSVADWILQAGIRYDDPDTTGSEVTRQAGFKSPAYGGVSLFANWGEGFKLPGFSALAHPLVGNPDLEPETSVSRELGVEVNFADDNRVRLSYFNNDYSNLVDFDAEQFRNVNRSEVQTSGFEGQWQWQAFERLNLELYGTYTDLDVSDENAVLMGRPQWVAGTNLDWQWREDLNLGLDYRWTDSRFAGSLHTGESSAYELSPNRTADVRLQWQPRAALTVQFAVDNLTDETNYQAVGIPSDGRRFRLSGTYRF